MPRVVPEYKEKAKDRIVEVAHKVFSEKGYYAATMDDVANRLGVSKGALYQYFKSKEDLYRAILDTRFRSMIDMLPSTSAGGSFSKTCQQFFESLTSDVSGLGLGFEVITEASRNPALAKVVRENYSETTNAIRSCLEQWRRDGSLRKDMNIDLVTRGLIAFYDGLTVNLAVGFERSEVRKVFSEFTRILEDGMHRKAA